MDQELPPGQEADEIQDLTEAVATSLAEGENPQVVAQQLIDSGWEPDQANGLVESIQYQLQEMESVDRNAGGESEVKGWLIWGGGILGINLLSWLFNWGFWIY